MDWFTPSADGKLVAISLSENGSENGTLHFFETATGRALAGHDSRRAISHRRRQRGVECRRLRHFLHALSARPANDRTPICISINKSGSTNLARRTAPTLMNWAAIFRASRKLNWPRATTANGCWPRSPTATAATTPIICAPPPGVAATHAFRRRRQGHQIRQGRRAVFAFQKKCAARKNPAAAAGRPGFGESRVVVPQGRGVVDDYVPSATDFTFRSWKADHRGCGFIRLTVRRWRCRCCRFRQWADCIAGTVTN